MQRVTEKNDPISKLVFELSKLPGVGEKTATRLAYYIVKQERSYSESLAQALLSVKTKIQLCSRCYTFTDQSLCILCSDMNRDPSVICVVERPSDVQSIEQTQIHRGRYHVLHGVLSPLDGIGPDELKIRDLVLQLQKPEHSVKEIILALNPSVEGEATSLYLSRLLRPLGVRTTRLAYGLPMGGVLEYADRQTISKALENRVEIA